MTKWQALRLVLAFVSFFGHEIRDASGQSTPAWQQGQAVGEWRQIPNTALASAPPSVSVPGNTGPISKIIAWCGMALDTRDSTLYSVANGGHLDYSGNEVDAIRLSDDAPRWVERRAPSSQVVMNQTHYPDGSPTSRHTYYNEWMIERRNRVMIFGIGSRYGDGGGGSTDGYNILTNNYDPAGTYPNVPYFYYPSNATVKDPASEDVYLVSNYRLQKWTQASNSWSTVMADSLIYGYDAASAFDSTRNRILFIDPDGQARLYMPASNTVSATVSFSGPNARVVTGGAHGMVYVSGLDAFLLRKSGAGSTVYRINANTFSVDTFPVSGGGSIPNSQNGVYTRFAYAPGLGGVVYVPDYDSGIWFLRTGNGSGAVANIPSAKPRGLRLQ